MPDTVDTSQLDTTPVDNVTPGDKWAFDDSVTQCFDNMLQRSIPHYDVMRATTFELAAQYVQDKTAIIDLGCSRGEALAPFIKRFGAYNRYVGTDVSEPMLEAARTRYEGYTKAGIVDIRNCDLRHDYPPEYASVTLAVLTLQFIPIEYRQQVVRNAYKHTAPGGCFMLVEKVLGSTADLDRVMVSGYRDLKARNGYTQDQINRKALSLEGVLVPLTAKGNVDLLRQAGFQHIDCYWRWLNFAAWIAVKD